MAGDLETETDHPDIQHVVPQHRQYQRCNFRVCLSTGGGSRQLEVDFFQFSSKYNQAVNVPVTNSHCNCKPVESKNSKVQVNIKVLKMSYFCHWNLGCKLFFISLQTTVSLPKVTSA